MYPRLHRRFAATVTAVGWAALVSLALGQAQTSLPSVPEGARFDHDWRLDQLTTEVSELRQLLQGTVADGTVPVGMSTNVKTGNFTSVLPSSPSNSTSVKPKGASPDSVNRDAVKVEPKKEYPDFKLSGFFHLDSANFSQSVNNQTTLGDIDNGLGFRRARLAASGNLSANASYMMEFDFAQAQARFVDVWGQFSKTPFGNVRIGRYRQPFGMTELTGVRELATLERPSVFALSPFRQTGMMLFDTLPSDVGTWAVSGFRALSDNYGNVYGDSGGYGTAERLTWVGMDGGDNHVIHFGLGHAFLDPARNAVQIASQDEVFVGQQPNVGPGGLSVFPIVFVPPAVQSGLFTVNHLNAINVEMAASTGSTVVQSEWRWSQIATPTGSTTVPAGYLQVRHMLSGEVIPYNRKGGVFGRVKPACPADLAKGRCGAWEVVGQVSYIDLDPLLAVGATGPGRRMVNYDCGLNWYVINNAKCQFHWIYTDLADRTTGNSNINTFATRFQIDY